MRKLFATLGVVSGALCGSFVSTPAHASSVAQGLYRISPWLAPQKSFDLPGGCPGIKNGASLALYNYDGFNCNYPATDQKWYIQQVGTNGNDGTAYANQPYYEILQGSSSSTECLDTPGGGSGVSNGVELDTWTCNGGTFQQWYFTQVITGNSGSLYNGYKLTNRYNTGYVLDLAGCATENGTHIQIWQDGVGACDNNNGQRWVLTRADQDMLVQDFSDDFTSLNTNTWNLETDNPGMVNSELEAYNPSQLSSDGQHLNSVAKYTGGTPGSSGAYVSGRMNAGGKAYYQNGAWSTQVRYTQDHPAHYGAWPAVWLLGEGIVNGTCWPAQNSREIDFMEWMFVNNWSDAGEPSSWGYDGNAIYGNGCGITDMLTNHLGNPDGNFNPNDWAIFKVVFDENVGTGGPQIHFYVNGNLQASWGMDAFYNQPMFPIINLAIGGGPLGAVNGDATGFNNTSDWAKLSVDWIAHESWCTASSMAAGNCTPGNVTTCAPITSCPSGDNCGTISNGCGGTVTCGGSCSSGQTCGGGGTANVCGGSTCTPITSCPSGDNCGTIPNGCGGTVTCGGSCSSPQTCGGGGTANVCGGGGGSSCAAAYSQGNCLNYTQGTIVSSGGSNWTCSNGNCANCAGYTSCAPGGSGCPWGTVWTNDGACH